MNKVLIYTSLLLTTLFSYTMDLDDSFLDDETPWHELFTLQSMPLIDNTLDEHTSFGQHELVRTTSHKRKADAITPAQDNAPLNFVCVDNAALVTKVDVAKQSEHKLKKLSDKLDSDYEPDSIYESDEKSYKTKLFEWQCNHCEKRISANNKYILLSNAKRHLLSQCPKKITQENFTQNYRNQLFKQIRDKYPWAFRHFAVEWECKCGRVLGTSAKNKNLNDLLQSIKKHKTVTCPKAIKEEVFEAIRESIIIELKEKLDNV